LGYNEIAVSNEFESFYASCREKLSLYLESFIGKEIEQERLRQASLHILTRGKMFRAFAALVSLKTLQPGCDVSLFMPETASLELVQCFTLIHDDLPALDNASLRRGVESVHAKFGEAWAILAGDSLLNLAYKAICLGQTSPAQKIQLIEALANALESVIEGQALELSLSGRTVSLEEVEKIMALKTASLISASFAFGAILAQADAESLSTLQEIGRLVGIAYQAKDDTFSVLGSEEKAGKSLSADEALGRPTIVAVLGIDGTINYFNEKMAQAKQSLARLPGDRSLLEHFLAVLSAREK